MNRYIKIFFIVFGMVVPCYGSVTLSLVPQPDYQLYNRLFAKYNTYLHLDGVDTNQIYPFTTLMFALWYNAPAQTKFFLKISSDETLIGFALCQLLTSTHVLVRQFVIDPEVFNGAMLAPLLTQCLVFMPQVTLVSVLCPATFEATIATLQAMGFSLNEDADFPISGIYQQWDLSLRSKCAICDVSYGPDFWQQPDLQDCHDQEQDQEGEG